MEVPLARRFIPRAGHPILVPMNTTFLSWQAFHPTELRCIEIDQNGLKLVYDNDAELELEFADIGQLDRFVSQLVISLMHREPSEEVMWN
jgi:hypothetical protein